MTEPTQRNNHVLDFVSKTGTCHCDSAIVDFITFTIDHYMVNWMLNMSKHKTTKVIHTICKYQKIDQWGVKREEAKESGARSLQEWLSVSFRRALVRGGTDLEKGYGDMRPWRPPFHASPVVRKVPISSKSVSSQDPLLRKFWNFSLNSLNLCPNFSSQAPQNLKIFGSQASKFGNFQFTSPQIWKF